MTNGKTTPTRELLLRLWQDYLVVYWKRLLLALIAMMILALTLSAVPITVEAIYAAFDLESVNTASNLNWTRPSLDQLIAYGPFVIAGLGLTYGLSQYAQSRLTLSAALDTLRDLQNQLFARFLELDYADQRTQMSGAIASHFTNDMQLLRETLTRFTNGVRDLMQFIGLCAIMLLKDALLFSVVILVYAGIGWPIAWLGGKLRTSAKAAQAETGNLAASITQSVKGAAMIKTYGLETRELSRASTQFDHRTNLLKKASYLRAINEPFVFFIGTIALSVVVVFMALRVQAGLLDGPSITGFVVALLLLSQPARGLSTLYAVMQEGLSAFERILTIIDRSPTITDKAEARAHQIKNAEINFKDVHFCYEPNAPIIKNFSLDIKPGTSVALVGASGAGKSTLLTLLPRLFDVYSGEIQIDGLNIKDYHLKSLREQISIVSQEAILFNESLFDNIHYGRLDATKAQVKDAAKAASIHDFIETLDNGYDTLAGENGERLSGGQKQRIAIARAFLKDAPILLLDEPTSALDAASEEDIQQSLAILQKNRTTLIVAHRLSTIQQADEIIVMDQGEIIERGRHEDLLEKNGPYKKLIELQFNSSH